MNTIIKIQQSQFSTDGPRMLIYNEDRSYNVEKVLSEEVKNILYGRGKAYFQATVIAGRLSIGKEVTAKNW